MSEVNLPTQVVDDLLTRVRRLKSVSATHGVHFPQDLEHNIKQLKAKDVSEDSIPPPNDLPDEYSVSELSMLSLDCNMHLDKSLLQDQLDSIRRQTNRFHTLVQHRISDFKRANQETIQRSQGTHRSQGELALELARIKQSISVLEEEADATKCQIDSLQRLTALEPAAQAMSAVSALQHELSGILTKFERNMTELKQKEDVNLHLKQSVIQLRAQLEESSLEVPPASCNTCLLF